ncbi:syntaxin-binding protein 4 [Thamnophis elegans]|uniref:syntaxin-binding protein 4 n=1 Tax=Thamnophis elegans TaxID=35005 RepID=UPI00137691E6|nr:syntaxin-binding protein 4 [Thamnophis elegans]XP_032064997.1 syntaxin-binding protein 4 [Thamnophis elegans]XP_032064998.1 syntaxin-binding protein 4 [Thamnophis elegans]
MSTEMASPDSNHPDMTFVGPHGTHRTIHHVSFSDCQNGLGIKIIGGCQDQSKEEYGIFIKEILPEKIADQLCIGDLILEVNGQKLCGVTNEKAVDMLQMASATNHVSLFIARDEDAKKEFLALMEKYSSHNNSSRNSPTQILTGVDSFSSGAPSVSHSLFHPKNTVTNLLGRPAAVTSLQAITNDSIFQIISVSKETGLGLQIVGGIDKDEGPLVYILAVIPGGDCHKDGRLRPGDQLVSVNGESLIGITYEEARNLINQTQPSSYISWEITFIRHDSGPDEVENMHPFSNLLNSERCGLQNDLFNLCPTLSSNENITAEKSDMMKTEFKKGEQFCTFSTDNSFIGVSAGAVSPSWRIDYGPQRKISLNPSVRLKADKLEMALKFLGIQPTKEEQEILRQQLPRDSEGTVCFGDFIQVARDLFSQQLDETGHSPVHEIAKLLDSQLVSCDHLERHEMEQLRKEKNEALKELCQLKEELAKSECVRKQLAEELQITKQEAKASVEEARTLRSRIHLAEAAQKQARGMELDYEEVISLLEIEITRLKGQLADHGGQNKESVQDLRKRVTVLDCQLRKSETAKKTFEVATEKLLEFVETVPEMLLHGSSPPVTLSDRKATISSKMLLAHLGRNGHTLAASLATEAKELARSVRAILEADCLPYGWEKAYTADGIKYFINHVTQTTSWIHPVTNVLALSCLEENEDDGFRELPDPQT